MAIELAIVVEKPKRRQNQRAKFRALEKLDAVIDAVRWRLRGAAFRAVYPEDYKRSVGKGIHHRRALAMLTDDERALPLAGMLDPDHVDYQDDAGDAIALWLWATGRLGTGGVPGEVPRIRKERR